MKMLNDYDKQKSLERHINKKNYSDYLKGQMEVNNNTRQQDKN